MGCIVNLLGLLVLLVLQDSAATIRAAKGAQETFERVRRAHLPISRSGFGGACDEIVGRFCYWYDPHAPPPPPELPVTTTARELLLMELGGAALKLPADSWIVGQRVRYFVEDGKVDSALAVVQDCLNDTAWCSALEGFAHHARGSIDEANRAFSRALSTMVPKEACEWADLSPLLDPSSLRSFRRLPCEARLAAAESLLVLARPLYSQSGNSLRSEFFSRQVMVRLMAESAGGYAMRFGDDQKELILRYGWPIGWSQGFSYSPFREGDIIGHSQDPAWSFLPLGTPGGAWSLDSPRAKSRYRPPGVRWLGELDSVQVARFPRGDSVLVVGVWRSPDDSVFNKRDLEAVLAVEEVGDSLPRYRRHRGPRRGVLQAVVATTPTLAALEVSVDQRSVFARHRVVWPTAIPSDGITLSDPLLFDPGPGVPVEFDRVLEQAVAGTKLKKGVTIGVYFEWSPLNHSTDSAQVSITVTQDGSKRPVIAWEFDTEAAVVGLTPQSVALDLSALRSGRHTFEVAIRSGGYTAVTQRQVVVY